MQLALFGGLNGRLPYAPKSIAYAKTHILEHSNNLVEAYQINNMNISCFILKKMMIFLLILRISSCDCKTLMSTMFLV